MKSLNDRKGFSLPKVLAVLLSIFLIVSISSCTEDRTIERTQELPSDQELTEVIRTQLSSSVEVPAEEIKVEIRDGIATLTGYTSNLLAKRKAEEIAQSINGVLAVVNNLKVSTTRADSLVDRDVDRALATDPATEEWEINSTVKNGIVILKGAVDSWQERKLADAIASRVKGVKEINNNIIVNHSGDRNDDQIKAEIERTLLMSSRVNGDMIDVSVSDGKVELSGAISSAYEKSIASELAHVTGVEAVETDRLEVHPEYESRMFRDSAIETLTARQIQEAINNAFQYDPRVPEDSISVTITGDVAVLEGTVLNLNSKLAAGDDARNTAGVNSVENNINVRRKVVVTPEVATSDSAIQERIRNSIIRDPYVGVTNITIKVDTGIVELKGNVASQYEKEQIEKIASNVKGVLAVENELTVQESPANT